MFKELILCGYLVTYIMPIWLNNIIIVISVFSFVITEPPKFICVCFKGTCSNSPLAAISAGYMYYYNTCVVMKFNNTANSKVLLRR